MDGVGPTRYREEGGVGEADGRLGLNGSNSSSPIRVSHFYFYFYIP
jgi:hypothetical protein